jgi:hypothetical protein
VRFHLRVLVDAGLVWCRTDPQGSSGRPRLVYTAATGGSGSQPDGFQLLADILASYLAASSTIPTGLAEEAGISAADAVRHVAGVFAELGFQPELECGGSYRRILLHACPPDRRNTTRSSYTVKFRPVTVQNCTAIHSCFGDHDGTLGVGRIR